MTEFLSALVLAVALEGAAYALFPNQMKAILERVREAPAASLRVSGLAALAVGVILLWLIRG